MLETIASHVQGPINHGMLLDMLVSNIWLSVMALFVVGYTAARWIKSKRSPDRQDAPNG